MTKNKSIIYICPLCGSESISIFHDYANFVLSACNNCDLVFQNQLSKINTDELISKIYDPNWVYWREKCSQSTFMEHSVFNNLLLNIFLPNKGNILEIGPGTGEFLFLAKKAGWNVVGIEPSLEACSYAKDKFGLELINAQWSVEAVEPNNKFDVVVFWHVLEHIADPIGFLEEVSSLLTPSGMIFFSVPNNKSFTNMVYGHSSPLYTEADHLFHYSKDNLKILLEKASLNILSMFSRQEPNGLIRDVQAGNQNTSINFEKAMALMAHLQSNFEGHEIYCIAKNQTIQTTIPTVSENKPLRIIQVAPDVYPLPSENYGGLEKIVYSLTEELVRRGHEVYLYAPKDTRTNAKLISYQHSSTWNEDEIIKFVTATIPDNIDIIHDHTHFSAIGRQNFPIPTVCTVHIATNQTVKHPIYVSKKALESYGRGHGFFVHNGLNPEEFEFSQEKQNYLLFLGVLNREKGTHCAIEVAEKCNQRLILAGPVHNHDYFSTEIEPSLNQLPNVEYIGAVSGKQKLDLLKHAQCVLFPSLCEEAFGLVIIEAMISGTPVLAFPNGAIPEVMHGFPDLICQSIDQMIQKVLYEKFPAPDLLHQYVLDNYTVSKMVDGYLNIYKKVIATR